MAAAATSLLASSVEKTNGAKLSRLLIDGGTTVLRKVFDGYHPPANLAADLNACYAILNNLYRRRILNGHQWDKLFPPSGVAPDSNTFDITLLFLLLTNICGLFPPPTGWHSKPPASDTSLEANLARIKFFRNVLYGHVTTTGVDTPTFTALWLEISAVLVVLGFDQREIDRLQAERGGEEDYLDTLREWADSEDDIKSQLKNMHQTQTTTQRTVEEVRQTQNITQQTVEKVRQSQTEDRKTLENNKSKLKEVQQSQTEMQHTVEEVAASLQEVKDAVENIKEGRDKDRADEVLRKLAKSEFIRDIEYYIERFQDGTREWVFNRVQNWLDDRSCQNRVMVISGNAGMGKSVISAVICKRMQEVGRLSGSHFCQHNNVRYRNPQLMLQSLACHLSHALPEYKQALVEQLSRNLGKDLNNMGVEELFSLLFKEPLAAVSDPGRSMLMVIDGLDESEYQGRNELLDVIASQFCKLPSWIRFLLTTRPATNIEEKLATMKPFQLESNDEKNLEDIRTYLENKLHLVIKPETVNATVERLIVRTEGLMLYAFFHVSSIEENPSVLNQDVDSILPSGISSVYHSYFKRLESELIKELDIKEEHFLNLLCAITASREPLPIDFVSNLLVPIRNSPLAKRKVLKAISSVSSLLPIRDRCLHVIHKSVKDWLTDISCYGEHEFIVDEIEGHRILADLCTEELDDLKRRGVGVHDTQFSATEKYSLHHGAHHMFYSDEERRPRRLEELTKGYILDLELMFAKLCVNNTTAAEELVWLHKQETSLEFSEGVQTILKTLLSLLRKYHDRFTSHPRVFLQTVLNEGGPLLSAEASHFLRVKYPEIPYVEYINGGTWHSGVLARFQCLSNVACCDVSPMQDYMVCECVNGMLQLWSLHTGRLIWKRPIKVPKNYCDKYGAYRKMSSTSALSFYRSVVFHPDQDLVLPGILSCAYTIEGELKPLFLESNCVFSVCSISGDKGRMLTDCPGDAKCLVMWSLENGSEIARVTRDEDVLSFAWSPDGRLLAISHSTGLICLVDVMNSFTTLAQTTTSNVCGMIKFSPDHLVLYCLHIPCASSPCPNLFRFDIVEHTCHTFSLEVCSDKVSYDPREFESISDCGFVLGDPIPLLGSIEVLVPLMTFDFLLTKQNLLRVDPLRSQIKMLNTDEVDEATGNRKMAKGIALSLDGRMVYVSTYNYTYSVVMVWDVSSGKLIAQKKTRKPLDTCLVTVREGVLLTSGSDTVELWSFDLSACVRSWTSLPSNRSMIPISEERVACIDKGEVIVLDTTSETIMSRIRVLDGRVVACNSRCQIVTTDFGSLQLSDNTGILWKKDLGCYGSIFSPAEKFVVFWSDYPVYVVDAVSGITLNTLRSDDRLTYSINDCTFFGDEECVVFCQDFSAHCLHLFNVTSGDLLSVVELEGRLSCFAACSPQNLIAIGLTHHWKFAENFIVIRVWLPQDEDSTKSKKRGQKRVQLQRLRALAEKRQRADNKAETDHFMDNKEHSYNTEEH